MMSDLSTPEPNGNNIDEGNTDLARERYNRRAKDYDQGMVRMDRLLLGKLRALQWSLVTGKRILEIGVGTGASFPYYPEGAEVVAIDLSDKMLAVAGTKAREKGIKVDLRLMDVQRLDFPAASFDSVVADCVFCSVPDPVLGLREIARVCKPEGQVVLLEHVRLAAPLGYLMDLANPLVVRMTGANINRRTLENVRRAGLTIERVDSFLFGIVKLIVARPQ
ncbi:MAG: methyltransferase domain-containing protein [Dehalococcoidia bacterium]|nr:methyltransferase domain-containing protein [Dehalococcoidia bacterium]